MSSTPVLPHASVPAAAELQQVFSDSAEPESEKPSYPDSPHAPQITISIFATFLNCPEKGLTSQDERPVLSLSLHGSFSDSAPSLCYPNPNRNAAAVNSSL